MKMLICGIDEAGRGPVIGPLVICGVLVDEEGEESLKSIGVKDSKLLTKKQREFFFEKIKKIAKNYYLITVQPAEIDLAVTGTEVKNLNFLEAKKTIEIIKKLHPDKTELVVAHKADVKYVTVGAASILAKVTRDKEIEKLEKKYGKIGSGYPADPVTKEFLKKNFNNHPEIFRHSWATMKELKNGEGQKKLGEF